MPAAYIWRSSLNELDMTTSLPNFGKNVLVSSMFFCIRLCTDAGYLAVALPGHRLGPVLPR